ncbi:MAG: endolytic transglycosylase MltG [Patescibacteria group bacterium]
MHVHYTDNVTLVTPKRSLLHRSFRIFGVLLVITIPLALLAAGYGYAQLQPPDSFPSGERITIEEGSTVPEIVALFKENNLIRSRDIFYLALVLATDPTTIKASTYRFPEPLNAIELAQRLAEGEFGIDLERFVHYEGERVEQIAERAEIVLEDFDAERFIQLALPGEGRLFPDTYLIPENFSADELYELMIENFEARVGPLRPAIEASNFTEEEVLILASILEREANSRESKRIVSGILQNRLDIDMALQADATIEYALEGPLNELAPGELARNLQELESPYNTYKNTGLPPTPIGNPGLTAIEAVLEPDASSYLFYITGRDGNFYYANNFTEHQANVNAYLR